MNGKLKKALVVLIGGFLALSAFIYVMANGLKAPEPLTAQHQHHPKKIAWSFDGAFGVVDKQSAQRGYQVYKEVCASCHSMKLISFRDLEKIGFSAAEVKAIAAEYSYKTVSDSGDAVDRPGVPNDKFHSPFENKQAAQAANNGAAPPDLSLMFKARHDGGNYIYSLLTGYGETIPADMKMNEGMNYNPYFAGMQIAMARPLNDGQVTYQDGTNASTDQMARDLVNFLQWAAEPEMEERKKMGLKVMLFLAFMTGFFYIAKIRIWAKIK